MANEPPNIQEFNQIAVVVFAKLYIEHPFDKTLDVADIAQVIGVSPTEMLPSGHNFDKMFERTIRWLHEQDFINTYGSNAREQATLTARGFAAMKVLPPALGGTPPQVPTGSTGAALVEATKAASEGNRNRLFEYAGSFTYGIIKSASGF
jgi:hypothetical protein